MYYNHDLSGADLEEADFEGANLSGANLSGANLVNANLSGADFCLLYTSDAADDSLRVDLGGRRIIKKT